MKNLCNLLRVSLGISPADSFPQLNDEQWKALKDIAVKQTVLGVAWGGIEKLPLEKQPPRRMKLLWMADTNEIKRRSTWMNKACASVEKKLAKVGLHGVILKGQGIASLYPTPEYRTPGDIDVLVSLCPPETKGGNAEEDPQAEAPKSVFVLDGDIDKTVKDVVNRVNAIGIGDVGKVVYHHMEWRFSDVDIEVHLRPMQFNNPFVNKCFQQWTKRFGMVKVNAFHTPDVEFNIIFMLSHLYHHLLFEGVGLRQVCDYAVLLHVAAGRWRSEEDRKEALSRFDNMLSELKMKRFAAGMMWIMHTMFGIPVDGLIVKPDEAVGRFVLNEIELAGNFGKFDDRIDRKKLSSTSGRFWERTKHRARFFSLFPSEIFWDIPFRLWHWTWRKRLG